MKSVIATTLLALFSTSLAAPSTSIAERDVTFATIALSNDQTGAYGSAQIPINGVTILINSAFANTGITQGGAFTASSASLVGGLANNPSCTIVGVVGGNVLGQLNAQKTYAKFGNPNMLETVSLKTGAITCTA